VTGVLAVALLTTALAVTAPHGPDLRVSALEAQQRAASPGELRVPTTVRNAGDRRADASRTRYLLSRDRRRGHDVRLATVRVAAIRAGRSRAGTAALLVPAGLRAGEWYVLACADAQRTVPERREGNNCSAAREAVDVLPQTEPQIPPLP
jgi:hypothetical protein